MTHHKERELIVEYGKKLITKHLTFGTSGNISILDRENNLMLISPSGVPYFDTKVQDIVMMKLDGTIVEGDKKPSSEWNLHAEMYKNKQNICSAIHTHSTYCTVLACLHESIKAVHYVIAASGSEEVPCAPYCTYGTAELAQTAANTIGNCNAVLLANHGMLAVGKDLKETFNLACEIEWCAEIQYKTMCAGKPFILDNNEIKKVAEKFKSYGQVKF